MSNINGKVYAMNAVTPMKTWKTWILRTIFFVLGHVKPLQKDLIDLSFIEFAWSGHGVILAVLYRDVHNRLWFWNVR